MSPIPLHRGTGEDRDEDNSKEPGQDKEADGIGDLSEDGDVEEAAVEEKNGEFGC